MTKEELEKAEELLATIEEEEAIEKWFNSVVNEDREQCITVAESARKDLYNAFNIAITPKAALLMYAITYENIIKSLISKRGDADSFVIDIANMVKIGYNNVEDTDSRFEVSGNFNIFIQHTGQMPAFPTERGGDTVEICTVWNSNYMQENIKMVNEIAANTVKGLAEYNLIIGFPEIVFPVFSKIHQNVVTLVEEWRKGEGKNDYFINFCNCYEVHAQLMEDKTVAVMFKPNISEKLNVKSNMIATAPTE